MKYYREEIKRVWSIQCPTIFHRTCIHAYIFGVFLAACMVVLFYLYVWVLLCSFTFNSKRASTLNYIKCRTNFIKNIYQGCNLINLLDEFIKMLHKT